MDNYDIIKELSDTTALAKRNETEIIELHNDVAEIKKENQAIHDIATSVKLIAQDMSYVKDDVAEVKSSQSQIRNELSEVKNAPIKSKASAFDSAWKFVVASIATGIVSFVLGNLFPQIFS